MPYQSVNPSNGEASKPFPQMTASDLERAIKGAAECFETWQYTSYNDRAKVVFKVADLMRSQCDDLAKLVTQEMGKLFTESQGEVRLSADILEYYARNAESFLAPEHLQPKTGEADVFNEPFGVLLGVQPWNFPYYQLSRFAAPNIMAGNTVLVKHAGSVPQCALAFEKLWRDAGAPNGLYTNLFITYDQVNAVIDDPRVKGVALTGSAEAGRIVAARAGLNLKKSTMELGGSDAFIVLADADLEETVQWAI